MPPRRRRDPLEVWAAVDRVLAGSRERVDVALAVRGLAEQLAERAPGRSVELRVPPHSAVQLIEGTRHTRGTPPTVVEVEPIAFVELCVGDLEWPVAASDGRVQANGERGDLSSLLPLTRPAEVL